MRRAAPSVTGQGHAIILCRGFTFGLALYAAVSLFRSIFRTARPGPHCVRARLYTAVRGAWAPGTGPQTARRDDTPRDGIYIEPNTKPRNEHPQIARTPLPRAIRATPVTASS